MGNLLACLDSEKLFGFDLNWACVNLFFIFFGRVDKLVLC